MFLDGVLHLQLLHHHDSAALAAKDYCQNSSLKNAMLVRHLVGATNVNIRLCLNLHGADEIVGLGKRSTQILSQFSRKCQNMWSINALGSTASMGTKQFC